MDEKDTHGKVEEAALVRAVEVLREDLLPARLREIADEKLVAAFMFCGGKSTAEVARALNIPLGTFHAWLAYDEEIREAIDRFNEIREQEIYTRVLNILAELLGRDDLTMEQTMTLLSIGVRMKRGSDDRSKSRRQLELKEHELELRMQALKDKHRPSFDWIIDLEQQQDDVFGPPDVSEQGAT